MGHFVSDSVGVKCVGVEKQQLLRFLCGIGFSGMEQHFHAGDVGFSVQRRRGHDRAGNFVPDSVCSCRIFAFDCKKSVEQKIVSQLFLYIFLDFLALVWVMTCNCFLLYHSSAFEDRYMEQVRSENYSKAELAVLRDYIVVNANELAEQMERDADGYLIYKGDMNQAAVEAMQQVGTDYGRLQGYYPQPKEIYFSELLSQTYRMGYYFPFPWKQTTTERCIL